MKMLKYRRYVALAKNNELWRQRYPLDMVMQSAGIALGARRIFTAWYCRGIWSRYRSYGKGMKRR